MGNRIANIWQKELRDAFRDLKGIAQATLIPLVIGIFYAVFNPLLGSLISAKAQQPLLIPAQGIEYAGQPFLDVLAQSQITLTPFDGDLVAAIVKADKAAGLIIPPGFSEGIAQEQTVTLTLLSNPTSGGIFGGGFSSDRLNVAINAYNTQVATRRVQVRSIAPALLTPITLDARNLATPEQLGGVVAAFLLPFLLAVVVAQSSMFVAIDVTAGEKERGTLEALLLTPATDFEVLTGKFAAVVVVGSVPMITTFLGFWVGSNLLPAAATNGGRLPVSVAFGAIAVGLPLAVFVDVLMMIISVRTKAFKDAQSALTPVVFALMVPSVLAVFVPPTNSLALLIPVYGASAVVSSLATGTPLTLTTFGLATLGSLLAASVGFMIALRFFNRERLLYGV